MLRDRPSIASVPLSILTSAYILFLTNFTFWEKGTAYFSNHKIQFVALAIAFFALFIAALTSFSVKYLIKPFFIFLIMVSAAASYFCRYVRNSYQPPHDPGCSGDDDK